MLLSKPSKQIAETDVLVQAASDFGAADLRAAVCLQGGSFIEFAHTAKIAFSLQSFHIARPI
jgi:hypothetical protein